MRRALGIDLSEWDLLPLNWGMARELLSFAFIKISQGMSPDPLFRAQWVAAEGYVLRGLYHMLDPEDDPRASADKAIELAFSVSPGELPPVLDLELGPPRTQLFRARTWLERWEKETGITPIVYTSPGFLEAARAGSETWLRRYPSWLASWPYDGVDPDAERDWLIDRVFRGDILLPYPLSPSPFFLPPLFHQWTSRARPEWIPGYYTGMGHKLAIDLNYYQGTEEDLFRAYGRPSRPPGNGDSMSYLFSITPTGSAGLKVRRDHYVIDSPIPNRIGSLSFGRYAFGDEKWISPAGASEDEASEVWLKVESVDGVALVGWMAAKHNGTRYGTIAPVSGGGETPEDPEPGPLEFTITINGSTTPNGLELHIDASSPGYAGRSFLITLPRE